MGQRTGGQRRYCTSLGLKSHHSAFTTFIGVSIASGQENACSSSSSWKRRKLSPRVLYTNTKHPSNLKEPHHLASGKSTALPAIPLNCPRMVDRNTVLSREEGIRTGPKLRSPFAHVSLEE